MLLIMALALSAQSFAQAPGVGFDPSKKTEIDAARAEWRDGGRVVIAEGGVSISQPGVILTAERMEVTVVEGSDEVERVVATGRVRYASVNGDAIAGERAVYSAVQGTLIVTGRVVVVQEGQVATGHELTYNTETGAMLLVAEPGGRVRGLLAERDDS